MAYVTLMTGDLMSDYALLKSQGVAFVSDPYGAPGNRFVFMRDPDGIYLKLEESPTLRRTQISQQTQIMGMPYIGIHVSDVGASVDFYRRFGYTKVRWVNQQTLTAKESAAWGFDQPVTYRGADVALDRGDRHRLRLLQWLAFTPMDSAV